jgi:alpha-L-fucosidase 2
MKNCWTSKKKEVAVPALWERIFDAGRYHYLSSSSVVSPPDLLGIWTGDCHAGWSGYYFLDANLNLLVVGGNIGDMPEAMEGYFTFMERLNDGFKTNTFKSNAAGLAQAAFKSRCMRSCRPFWSGLVGLE